MGGTLDFTSIHKLTDSALRISESSAWMFALSKREIQQEIIRMNQEQLYEHGIDSLGKTLGDYRPLTIEIKRKKGERYDHVTLFDEGDFYASFRVEYGEDWFEVIGNDMAGNYDRPLFEIYGENVMGLTEFNLERMKPLILKYYAQYVSNIF